MAVLGFESVWEVITYATCVLLGVSMLMPLNALASAPFFMINYYKYVTGDEFAEPNNKHFWANILTFYNVVSVGTQILCGPTVLSRPARQLSLRFRFFATISLMMVEVLVVVVLPAGKVSQTSAIVAFLIVTVVAGLGKSYLEGTCYALVGTMPSKYMSAIMFGCGFSGVIASVIQCIVKASMSSSYESVLRQSHIYFSLALCIMFVSMVMALLLEFNPFAQKYVAEYRMAARRRRGSMGANEEDEAKAAGTNMPDSEPYAEFYGDCSSNALPEVVSGTEVEGQYLDGGVAEASETNTKKALGSVSSESADVQENSQRAVADAAGAQEDQRNMTTSEQMLATAIWPVIKAIYPMQICCFCVFFLSLLIFPSLLFPIDRADPWFGTIGVLLYNCGDAVGRLSTSIRFLWPRRGLVMIFTGIRYVFLPLIMLCIYGYIPGHAPPYVFMFLIGITNGYFGAICMVYGPLSKGIVTDGQRVMAGQAMGVSLLAGASIASLLALLIVLFLPA